MMNHYAMMLYALQTSNETFLKLWDDCKGDDMWKVSRLFSGQLSLYHFLIIDVKLLLFQAIQEMEAIVDILSSYALSDAHLFLSIANLP